MTDFSTTSENLADKMMSAVGVQINMPDHGIRSHVLYQLFVRLARPTLDWVTVGAVYYHLIGQPFFMGHFDVVAAGITLAWAAAVYGIKTYEKKAGVA